MVKLSRAKSSPGRTATRSPCCCTGINDFERISDHTVNLMDSVQEMHDKKNELFSAAAGELHVLPTRCAISSIVHLTASA